MRRPLAGDLPAPVPLNRDFWNALATASRRLSLPARALSARTFMQVLLDDLEKESFHEKDIHGWRQ